MISDRRGDREMKIEWSHWLRWSPISCRACSCSSHNCWSCFFSCRRSRSSCGNKRAACWIKAVIYSRQNEKMFILALFCSMSSDLLSALVKAAVYLTICRPCSCWSCVRSSVLLSCSRCSSLCMFWRCSFSTLSSDSRPALYKDRTATTWSQMTGYLQGFYNQI